MSNLTQKTWDEFRATGLFMFVNSILHAFGWTLAVKVEDGKATGCFPYRTKFRGFSDADTDEMHQNIGAYLKENADTLYEESR